MALDKFPWPKLEMTLAAGAPLNLQVGSREQEFSGGFWCVFSYLC